MRASHNGVGSVNFRFDIWACVGEWGVIGKGSLHGMTALIRFKTKDLELPKAGCVGNGVCKVHQ